VGHLGDLDLSAIALQRTPMDVMATAIARTDGLVADGGTFAAVPEGDVLRMRIAPSARDPRFTSIRVRPGVGLGGYAMVRGEPALVDDYAHDSRISHEFAEIVAEGEGLISAACAPVLCGSRVEGLLYVGHRRPERIDDRVMEQVERAAVFAAIGIEQCAERRRQLELDRLRERERLATQLHDSVAQRLFGIGVAAYRARVDGDPAVLADALQEVEQAAALARQDLRSVLERLVDAGDGLAFEARLEGELQLLASRSGCRARLRRLGCVRPLPDPAADLVVDAALEGVRNAVKHAGAIAVLVALEFRADGVELAVQTEAAAGPRMPAHGPGTSCGLANLRARARGLGGRLALEDDRAGKLLRLWLPVRA
jgi:signal transduction histidine kinase